MPPIGAGGLVSGTVKSGNTQLPGPTITAVNTLTGKRYSTVTDVRGIKALILRQLNR